MAQLKEKIDAVLEVFPFFHLFERSDTTIDGTLLILLNSVETKQYVSFYCWESLLYLNISILDAEQKLVHHHYEFAFAAEAAALREPKSRAEWIECLDVDDAVTRAFARLKYHTPLKTDSK